MVSYIAGGAKFTGSTVVISKDLFTVDNVLSNLLTILSTLIYA